MGPPEDVEQNPGNDQGHPDVHYSMDTLIAPLAQVTPDDFERHPDQGRVAPVTIWHAALIQVYEDRYNDFVRLAYLITGQGAIAEEIVQDAFIASHRSWDGVRDPAPYVRAAIVNRCYSWGRRHKLERERQVRPAEPSQLVADEMWDALATLNHRQRAAIVLRFYLDLPDKEIADVLGCRLGTVRTAIHRGLRALRKVLEP